MRDLAVTPREIAPRLSRSSAVIELRTLGTLDLRDGPAGVELRSILAQPKRTGLLCYLALARPHGFHRRDKLLALFWPETDTDHARASLRQAVRFLRRALGEAAIQSRGEEELALGEDVLVCDAVAFEQALAAGEPERALALYAGDLLPGFYVQGAPEFERWLEAERMRLRERAAAGAWAAADASERAHDVAGAAEWGRRGSALAPGDDTGLRRLIQLLDRLGDPDGALTAYHAGVRRLRVEYEIEPSRETIELGEDICERVRAAAAALSASVRAAAVAAQASADASARLPEGAGSPSAALPAGAGAVAEGVVPQRGPRRWLSWARRRGAWLSLAVAAMLLGAAGGAWLLVQRRPASGPRVQRLVVAPFENRTGDTALARLGEMAADWITQGVAEAGIVEVAEGSAGRAVARQAQARSGASGPDLVRTLAERTFSDLVVLGRYYRQADSLAFVAQVVDARSGRVLRAVGPIAASTSAPVEGVDEVRQRLLAELAVQLGQDLAAQAPAFRPPKYEAYREFLEGVYRSEVRDERYEAVENFRRAYALDTTFYHALVAASFAALTQGPRARYDSMQPMLARVWDRLSLRDRYGIELQRAYRKYDYRAIYRIQHEAARRFHPLPDNNVFGVALSAGYLHRYRESLDLMRRVNPNLPLTPRWYWVYRGGAQHMLDDYRGQLRAAAEMARRQPESVVPDLMRLVAHAAMGHTAEVRRLARALAAAAARDTMTWQETKNMESLGAPACAPAIFFFLAARELAAHGHDADARVLVDDGLRWFATRPVAQQPDTTSSRWVHAQLLALAGRWREAEAELRAAPDSSWDVSLDWSRAMVAARLRDRARALEISQRLRGARPLVEFQRISILAALGEREEVRRRLREHLPAGTFFGDWWLHTEPVLQPYLREPEFRRMLRADG